MRIPSFGPRPLLAGGMRRAHPAVAFSNVPFHQPPSRRCASTTLLSQHSSCAHTRIRLPCLSPPALVRHKSSVPSSSPQPISTPPGEQGLIQRALARLRPPAKEGEPYPSLTKLWGLASTQKKTILLALVLLIISSGVTLAVPAVIGRLIDLIGSDGSQAFWGLPFNQVVPILVLVFAVGAASKAGSNILLDMAAIRLIQNLRQRSFASALRQDVEWADKHAGDVVSRLSVDTTIVGDSLTSDVGDGLRAAVTVVAASMAMLWISTDLTYLMLGIVPPTALGAVWYGRYIRGLTHKAQDAVGKMTDVAQERLAPAAFRTIAAYNAQMREERRLLTEIKAISHVQVTEAKATGYFYAGSGFIGNCAVLTLLAYGGTLVSQGVLTTGDLTSLMMYTAYLGGGLANLTGFFASVMRGMGAGARVFALMEREPHIQSGKRLDAPDAGHPAIEFRNVDFSYPSRPEKPVLQDFSLTIPPGTSVALCGSSGVGKSSVHSLVLRLYDADRGQVLVAGHDVREYQLDKLRDLFGVVGQDPVMFEGTIAENIAYSRPGASMAEIEAAAEAANCMDFIRALPLGLQTNARQLSGGQRQRISIARSLLRGAPILLMDEATSALDTYSEQLINSTIQEIVASGRATVWIIAHRLSTIKSADLIVVLDQGRVAEMGSFQQLNVPGSKFEALVRAQLTGSEPGRGDLLLDSGKEETYPELEDISEAFVDAQVEALQAAEQASANDQSAGQLRSVLSQAEVEAYLAMADTSPALSDLSPPAEDPLDALAAAQLAERMALAETHQGPRL